jgi:hypothetical protein
VGKKQDMGANLEELEKAGLSEPPPIAESFTAASTALTTTANQMVAAWLQVLADHKRQLWSR